MVSNSFNSVDFTGASTSSLATATYIADNTVSTMLCTGSLNPTRLYYHDRDVDTIMDVFDSIVLTLSENELIGIINKLEEVSPGSSEHLVEEIIKSRHCSEDFLLTYFPIASKDIVKIHHRAEIQSGVYARLKLLFETNN